MTKKKNNDTDNIKETKTAAEKKSVSKHVNEKSSNKRVNQKKEATKQVGEDTVTLVSNKKQSPKRKPSTTEKKANSNKKPNSNDSVVELKFVVVEDEGMGGEQKQPKSPPTPNINKKETANKSKSVTDKKVAVNKTISEKDNQPPTVEKGNKKEQTIAEIVPSQQSDKTDDQNKANSDNILHIPKINLFLSNDNKEKKEDNKKTEDSDASKTSSIAINDTDKSFINDAPAVLGDQVQQPKSFTWVQYNSEKINRTYFVPLLGVAHRFYPRLYYCENRVKLVTYINGKEVVYEENSVSDKRSDFDFLPVLFQWRIQYMRSSLNFDEKHVDAWISLEDDLIALHNIIRIKYTDSKIKDLIQFVNIANGIVNTQLFNHKEFIFTNVHGYTEVEISKLFIKYNIEFKFKGYDRSFQKHINVVLE